MPVVPLAAKQALAIVPALLVALTLAAGCGSGSPAETSSQAIDRRARQQERRELPGAARAEAADTGEIGEAAASECDPNYSGACLNANAYDYDCAGGSGNGPEYTGTVTVTGDDHFELDADGDRVGCEPY